MKILFLCKTNVFRSQIAEGFFNKYSKNHKAKSAALLKHWNKMHKLIIRAMKEKEIDISNNKSEIVTKDMINWADKIILMSPDLIVFAEKILKEKMEIWNIEDKDISEKDEDRYIELVEAREMIEEKVKDLINKFE